MVRLSGKFRTMARDSNERCLCVDIEKFIDLIVIDPRADGWVKDMITSYCLRLLPTCPVIKSDLYETNKKVQFVTKYVPVQ